MRTIRLSFGFLAVAGCVLILMAGPARAGVDVDFGATVQAGDHTDLFDHGLHPPPHSRDAAPVSTAQQQWEGTTKSEEPAQTGCVGVACVGTN